jgi:dolichyl-diphosphooligosaccharide--protein glycosyltransferase
VTPPWLKVFERVPGATVQGEGPANSNVTAAVEMYSPTTDSHFVYRQIAETGPDGQFEMTLPYSSTGYEEYGPENGYTNVSTRATGPYQFYEAQSGTNYFPAGRINTSSGAQYIYQASANVTEAQVVGEDASPVTVELERRVTREGTQNAGGESESGDGSTGTTDDSADGTTDGSTDGTTNGSTGTTTEQPSLATPRRAVSP